MKKINNYIIRSIARGKNNIVWTSCLILFDFIRCRRRYNNNINVHLVFIRHWISTGRFVYTPLPPWENFQFDHLLRPPVSVYWNYCFFFHGIQHAAALKTRPRDVENIIRVAKARLYFGFYFFFRYYYFYYSNFRSPRDFGLWQIAFDYYHCYGRDMIVAIFKPCCIEKTKPSLKYYAVYHIVDGVLNPSQVRWNLQKLHFSR